MLEVNVLGYGQMGRQIASLLCLFGCDVAVWSRTMPSDDNVLRQLKLAGKLLGLQVERNSIRVVPSIGALNKHAITIEAVAENIAVKQEVFHQCKSMLHGGYYTNSSSYSPAEIGNEVGGLHFFNPISLRLVEYCQPLVQVNDDVEKLLSLLRQRQFHLVNVQQNRGYLANSLLFREIANVFLMIEQYKYSPATIDSVYMALQKEHSVFDIVDLVGVDTTYAILENLKSEDGSIHLPASLRLAFERGILGKKNKTSIKKFLVEIQEI